MILFIFEGKNQEPKIYKTLERLFFSEENDERIYVSYCSNIYNFYNIIRSHDLFNNNDSSIPLLIKEEMRKHPDLNPHISDFNADDISQVFIFFDYDIQNSNATRGEQTKEYNLQIQEMLSFFNDETNHGKLYINYPMVDSYRYTDKLPDDNYYTYEISLKNCNRFKELLAKDKPLYRNEKRLQIREIENEYVNNDNVLRDWKYINSQNIAKANYVCTGQNTIPIIKETVTQDSVFKNQLKEFVYKKNTVSILNSFPLFLMDYFKDINLILPEK